MSARERSKKNTLIFPSAQDGILLFHYRLAVYISLFVTLRKVFRRASCNALRWHKVNTIRRVCIAQYLTVVSFNFIWINRSITLIRAETELGTIFARLPCIRHKNALSVLAYMCR